MMCPVCLTVPAETFLPDRVKCRCGRFASWNDLTLFTTGAEAIKKGNGDYGFTGTRLTVAAHGMLQSWRSDSLGPVGGTVDEDLREETVQQAIFEALADEVLSS